MHIMKTFIGLSAIRTMWLFSSHITMSNFVLYTFTSCFSLPKSATRLWPCLSFISTSSGSTSMLAHSRCLKKKMLTRRTNELNDFKMSLSWFKTWKILLVRSHAIKIKYFKKFRVFYVKYIVIVTQRQNK